MAHQTITLPVTGMTCGNCAATIERVLNKKTPGVVKASVNFATERVLVEYVPAVATLDDIIAAIKKAGYDTVAPDEDLDEEDAEQATRNREIKDQTQKFVTGLIFTIPLFFLSMARDFNLIGVWSQAAWINWLFWVLATPVQFYTGADYYAGGLKSLKNRSANMDVLVAMGSSVAYVYSCSVLVMPSLGHGLFLKLPIQEAAALQEFSTSLTLPLVLQ